MHCLACLEDTEMGISKKMVQAAMKKVLLGSLGFLPLGEILVSLVPCAVKLFFHYSSLSTAVRLESSCFQRLHR